MMEKYQENNVSRDMFYEEQKRDKIKAAQEEVLKNKEKPEEKVIGDMEPEPEPESEVVADTEPEPEVATEPEVESPPEPVNVGGPTSENKLDKDLTESLEGDDPWMQQKISQQK